MVLRGDLLMGDHVNFCCRPVLLLTVTVVQDVGYKSQSVIQHCSDPHSLVDLNAPGLLHFNPYGPVRVSVVPLLIHAKLCQLISLLHPL